MKRRGGRKGRPQVSESKADRRLDARESLLFAERALLLRYPSVAEARVMPETLLEARRPKIREPTYG